MRKIGHYIILLLTVSMLTSCILENSGVASQESLPATLRVVVTRPDTTGTSTGSASTASASTRTAVALRSFSEDNVADLHVAVYNSEGTLTGHAYSSGSAVSVTTRSGTGCTVYALTNTGNENLAIPSTQEALKKLTTGDITDVDGIKVDGNLVMGGSLKTDISAGDNALGTFAVTRLAARNIMNITCGEGITLTGYAIKNLPVRSWYAARPNTAEADASDDAVGDDAVDPDVSGDWLDTETFPGAGIAIGTSTYAFTFYQYENRKGGRITVGGTTGNATDQSQKATYAPERATYVELYVNANGTTITYQLYLGANAANYNVKRNGSYKYIISIGASGINVSSVSIESWTEISGGSTIEM
jgi:hypothetical protein